MPVVFNRQFTVTDSEDLSLQGLSDLIIRQIAGRVFIYTSGEYESGLNSFEVLADQSVVSIGEVEFAPLSGTYAVAGTSIINVVGKTFLLPSGRFSSGATTYQLLGDGTYAPAHTSGYGVASYSNFAISDTVKVNSVAYVYASRWGEPGIQWFKVDASGTLTRKGGLADTNTSFLKDVSDIEVAYLYKHRFLFTASAIESGVQCYKINLNGSLGFADRSGPSEKWGLSAPTVLESVQMGSQAFVIVGAAESGSITVFAVSKTGNLTAVDHLLDTLSTRFDSIQALTKIEISGRVFLLAGGGDDGITLLQLSPYGQLSIVSVLADEWDTTLADVSSIQVSYVFGALTVIVGSSTDHGFTAFSLDLGNLGAVLKGTILANSISGTTNNDDIYGNGGKDSLFGRDGDDRLSDGTGIDLLSGGPGFDIFIFSDDGVLDTILDFETGIDRIDLSGFNLLYHFSELAIEIRDYGYDIRFGDDLFVVKLAAAASTEEFHFSQTDFIFG